MESPTDNPPLIVIVGPTASGKSKVAIRLAKKYNGEIIAADSRTIYKDLDIGTAKPTVKQQEGIRHHLIDFVKPDQVFTAADFKKAAMAAIADINARRKVPIIVGGTGLYIDSILFDFAFRPVGDLQERERLQSLPVGVLQKLLHDRGISLPANDRNPRHLIRRLETGEPGGAQTSMRANTLIIGMEVDRELLKERIKHRVSDMFAHGLVEEALQLGKQYGWDSPSLQTIGYREFKLYAEGVQTLEMVQEKIVQDTISYAKRQRTWFARNKSIHWADSQEKIEDLITTFLSK